jgi:hypothetical protein
MPSADLPILTRPAGAMAQGRFIVHRADTLNEHMHEVIVDLQGLKFTAAGEIVKHGTFGDVAASLGALRG